MWNFVGGVSVREVWLTHTTTVTLSSFLLTNDENTCKSLYAKSPIYWWNDLLQKGVGFSKWKSWNTIIFMHFLKFHNMHMTKNQILPTGIDEEKLSCWPIEKNAGVPVCRYSKHVKNRKPRNYEKILKSSIRLQMRFWIAETMSIWPEFKIRKNHIAHIWKNEFFASCMCFFFRFWKVKNYVFAKFF